MFGQGISREGDILDLAADAGIVSKSGAWYAYNGDKIGQGRENAKNYLRENPLICEEIDAKVRAKYSADLMDDEDDEDDDVEETMTKGAEPAETAPARGRKPSAKTGRKQDAAEEAGMPDDLPGGQGEVIPAEAAIE